MFIHLHHVFQLKAILPLRFYINREAVYVKNDITTGTWHFSVLWLKQLTWKTEVLNGLDDLIRNRKLLAARQILDIGGLLQTGIWPPHRHVSADGARGDWGTPDGQARLVGGSIKLALWNTVQCIVGTCWLQKEILLGFQLKWQNIICYLPWSNS